MMIRDCISIVHRHQVSDYVDDTKLVDEWPPPKSLCILILRQ